jgi:hypothetical protein
MAKRRLIGDDWCRLRRGKWVVIPFQWVGHTTFRSRMLSWSWVLCERRRRAVLQRKVARLIKRETTEEVLDFFEDRVKAVE